MTRRVMVGGIVVAAGGAAIVGASSMSTGDYDAILTSQLRPLAPESGLAELVRYATLAASSHNTQPWRFRAAPGSIAIEPDFGRRTPVVDPDDHHLFASLGCAAENLNLAARARGASGEIAFDPAGDGRIEVALAPSAQGAGPLFAAIPERQCSRASYDGSPVSPEVIARLEAAARSADVQPIFVLDDTRRDALLDLVLSGNSAQLDDPAFRTELKSWIRFNARAAAATRDGLYSATTGNPSLPSWLGPFLYDLTVRKEGDNAKVAEQIRSSSGLVVFSPATDERAGWVAVGRAYQRFALQATLEGLRHAFVNQAVEVPAVRAEVQSLLALGVRRPSLVVRFGRGPAMPRSLRRPVEDVLTA
jgi:hypothetical protein